MLSDILSQHFYARGSIVSNDGLIIFSHDPSRMGTKMALNSALRKRLASMDSGRFSSEADGLRQPAQNGLEHFYRRDL
ncbi:MULTISPECIES: hypothetical protein [Leclercia]|uniref:hypothetical protein n=1 Tax=Leclercia TaxID=83654 RepID=UPI00352A5092